MRTLASNTDITSEASVLRPGCFCCVFQLVVKKIDRPCSFYSFSLLYSNRFISEHVPDQLLRGEEGQEDVRREKHSV